MDAELSAAGAGIAAPAEGDLATFSNELQIPGLTLTRGVPSLRTMPYRTTAQSSASTLPHISPVTGLPKRLKLLLIVAQLA